MINMNEKILGPFGWPKFENEQMPLPKITGVYIMAVEYFDGYLPFGVGITRRPMRKRFVEHSRSYLEGNYNILDMDAAQLGRREVLWKGWGWTPVKRTEYENRKSEVTELAKRQMSRTRIFVIDMGVAPRLLERLEAAIANHFYKSEDILFDRGMLCMPRWKSEEPLHITFNCDSKLFGLPAAIEI